jgi:hypothetical protein
VIFVKILAAAALIGSIGWFASSPGFEPAIAVVTSVSALLSAFLVERRRKTARTGQTQTLSDSAIGIQAGQDVHVGTISSESGGKSRRAK